MMEEIVNKIKQEGYWRINFRPLGAPQDKSLQNLKELVSNNQVQLRGWYYPYYREGSGDTYRLEHHNNHIAQWVDWNEFKEYWRLYKSGQFIQYSAVQEDWYNSKIVMGLQMEPRKYLNFIGSLIYFITEIMEFLTRLNKSGLYPDGVQLNIELNNTYERQLESFEPMRFMSFPKITFEDPIIFEEKYSHNDLIDNPADLAIKPILHFFDMFNFGDVSVDAVIKRDQEGLYGYKGGTR